MRIMVFAEDPRLDQYMLKPMISAAVRYAGRPRALVTVCQDSRQRGDSTVIHVGAIEQLIADYPGYDWYILCVDRDCSDGREASLNEIEGKINARFASKRFLAIGSIEELEVWVLAGMHDIPERWASVREHCHPKEAFFEPYARQRRVDRTPGRGRKLLGQEAARNYENRVRVLCPEVQRCEIRG